ncbi:F-box domain-containing protein [Artemisia annua]|uniref:F-box domain-containing protein n=1 Tax=Artemisia annua TaxID=35608 RepID=A0A2U1KB31_ARTAN|nr:F-box domain-containing protein [Artemisia annua]
MRFASYIALGLAVLKNVFTVLWNLTEKDTVTTELPSNIILMEILPRLPTKLLGRCLCVCKEWKSFLSTHKFAKMHHQYVSGYKLFQIEHTEFGQRPLTIRMINCEAPNVSLNTVHISSKYTEHLFSEFGVTTVSNYSSLPYNDYVLKTVYVVASFDGLVCLAAMLPQELAFWNPLTQCCIKKLSDNSCSPRFYKPSCTLRPLKFSPDNISSSSDVIGFYIDSSNDYKLLHMVSNDGVIADVLFVATERDFFRVSLNLVPNPFLYLQLPLVSGYFLGPKSLFCGFRSGWRSKMHYLFRCQVGKV